ncbi:uncharacterized protein CLUP02_10153 [Colletotrichum lupini]|uniref:Uncharacterized protein n=1 Tax=Colletotrichum lupini TaxID=145971 RepID=A0A9Q8SW45_9PEZI|nr:uncharacterized protein CLUP02_10153 [Colletotrichum lupini]UQC84657.1 hypothetical protein CLUP02_10153 [Colletotrichum lupini]
MPKKYYNLWKKLITSNVLRHTQVFLHELMAIFSAPLHSPLLYSSFRHPEVTRVSQLSQLCPKWVVSETGNITLNQPSQSPSTLQFSSSKPETRHPYVNQPYISRPKSVGNHKLKSSGMVCPSLTWVVTRTLSVHGYEAILSQATNDLNFDKLPSRAFEASKEARPPLRVVLPQTKPIYRTKT